ncbi:MAG: hypothetical protein IPK26_29660 [Planctomycetes bacterium]|nr:hypothetical protein [Planctomycetota bacterium]
MNRTLVSALLLLSVLPAGGCCTLSRLFCGPDSSPWVPIAFGTPQQAMTTFLEAIRRDDVAVAYQCLAEEFKQQQGVDGLGVAFAWEQVKNRTTGLHLLGYADPGQPLPIDPSRCRFEFSVHGVQLRVALVRQNYWDVRYRRPDGSQGTTGAYVSSLHGLLHATTPDNQQDRSRLTFEPVAFDHDGMATATVEQIDAVAFGRDWKIASIESPE